MLLFAVFLREKQKECAISSNLKVVVLGLEYATTRHFLMKVETTSLQKVSSSMADFQVFVVF